MAGTNPQEQVSDRIEGPAAHDRVAMLSLHADGSAAQLNPEVIVDPEDAKKGLTTQLHQQAVSAHDGANEPLAVEDAEKLYDAAKAKADSVIEELKTTGEPDVGVAAKNEATAKDVSVEKV